MSDKQLRHVRWREFSVVMQSAMNALNPVMTVAEQMRDACRAHSTMSKDEIAERSAEVLRLVSIDPVHLDSYPHQLSGGMRQRSMIAMALLFTPELVIMDEPTSALDVVAQRSLMRQIKDLQDRLGFAVIFVTHDISLVRHFSDRLMVMYAGQVAELGPTATSSCTPRHPYSRALLEAVPSIRGDRSGADRYRRVAAGRSLAASGLPLPAALCRRHARVRIGQTAALPTRWLGRPLSCCTRMPRSGRRRAWPANPLERWATRLRGRRDSETSLPPRSFHRLRPTRNRRSLCSKSWAFHAFRPGDVPVKEKAARCGRRQFHDRAEGDRRLGGRERERQEHDRQAPGHGLPAHRR